MARDKYSVRGTYGMPPIITTNITLGSILLGQCITTLLLHGYDVCSVYMYRTFVHSTPAEREKSVYVREVSHALPLMAVTLMTSDYVVRL